MRLDQSSMHVFPLRALPGVGEDDRAIVAPDAQHTSLVVLLPDRSFVLITADRAVYVTGNQVLTLSQWQYATAPDLPAEMFTQPDVQVSNEPPPRFEDPPYDDDVVYDDSPYKQYGRWPVESRRSG